MSSFNLQRSLKSSSQHKQVSSVKLKYYLINSKQTIIINIFHELNQNSLTLSWRTPLSYRNQSIDLLCKSMEWFLYDNGVRHESVRSWRSFDELNFGDSLSKNFPSIDQQNFRPKSTKTPRQNIQTNCLENSCQYLGSCLL